MLSKQTIRRLTVLCDFMEKLPPEAKEHFDMSDYFFTNHVPGEGFSGRVKTSELYQCGTQACALGWAATVPSFKRAGLYIDGYDEMVKLDNKMVMCAATAAMEFFGLDSQQEGHVFGGGIGNIKTPKQWARMCRRFIAKNGDLSVIYKEDAFRRLRMRRAICSGLITTYT